MSEKNTPHHFSKLAEELIGDLRRVPLDEPRRQIKRATKPLADLVEALMQKHHIGRDAPEHTIREHWVALVGAANASYSHPVAIERGRLTVLASHAVVRNEIFMHRDAIVEKIKQLPGCKEVRNLNIRAG
ncbi:MAG: DUF721 domain-containing protein [Opitutaceae bacterium]|nr:DUF721 domain-containing protein [Opitutaceae bacterium]